MWTEKEIRNYLHTLTTMVVIYEGFRLNDLKAHYLHQNLDPSEDLWADIQLARQKVQAHFDLITIILNSQNSITTQFMADINLSVAPSK